MSPRSTMMAMVLIAGTTFGRGHAMDATALRTSVGPKVETMLARYRQWDAARNEGRGRSDETTSGDLAWGESSFLRNYVRCYRVSQDRYWLDKVVDHFDRMISHLSPEGPDGFRRWTDATYGVALIRAFPESNTGAMRLEPALQRPWMTREGADVTGHRYRITLAEGDRVVLSDLTANQEVATLAYQDGLVITAIPGAKLTLSGAPRVGARFLVETTRARPTDFVVHDGMIAYPIAQWIEIVSSDPALKERYGAKAISYIALLDRHMRQKWEACWVELPGNAGAYTFTNEPTERFPGFLLPHNQYLALGRAYLVLQAIPEVPDRAIYREKAEKMARYFKANLRESGKAFVWNYWDPRPQEAGQIRLYTEDTGHGTIDIGFALEAWRRGIVFTQADVQRFAATCVDVMWNQSLENPRIAGTVDGKGAPRSTTLGEWLALAEADARVWDVGWACFSKAGEPVGDIPQVLETYQRLVGDRAQK